MVCGDHLYSLFMYCIVLATEVCFVIFTPRLVYRTRITVVLLPADVFHTAQSVTQQGHQPLYDGAATSLPLILAVASVELSDHLRL